MSDTYIVEFDLVSEAGAIGAIAVTVDPGDNAFDAVTAVHNGYADKVTTTPNGGRYYRTAQDGVPVTFHIDSYNRVSTIN